MPDPTGSTVPRTVIRRPTRIRLEESAIPTRGSTVTRVAADSSRGRPSPPPKTARTEPLAGRATCAAQCPSAPQDAPPTGVQAAPAAWYSIASGAPLGEEPSAKRSSPERATGRRPRTRLAAARAVTREAGE